MKKKLTDKQKRFIEEYCVDFNATQAAIRSEYSKKTARQIATNLLSNVYIQEAIQKYMDKLSKKLEFTKEDALKEYEEARQVAIAGNESSAMSTATTGKCKVMGLHLEKVEHSGTLEISVKVDED